MRKNAEQPELTAAQREAARRLVFGYATRAQAAEAAGVHYNTLHRWLGLPEFRAHLAELEAQRDEDVRAEARSLLAGAMRGAKKAIDKAALSLDGADAASDISSLGNMLHTYLKTLSAQVGPVERHAVEATVRTLSDEVAAARLIAAGELAPDDED